MKINPLNVYSQYEVRNQNQADNIQKLINENVSKVVPKQKQEPKKDQLSLELKDQNKILSPQEREFFVKMFPESSQKIENHVLFNRNGKVQSYSYAKGLIVDAKV
ncbi:MAG: hypothetical protein CH6_1279 [Candidatus Kapaibacterium sp.]|nr:MAG: hypothetical protein CH6_1279 [Candidatus Kapabacteria bacterium]